MRRAEPEGGQAARDVFVAIAYFIYIFLHPFRADARASSWKYHTTDSRVADARGMIVVPVGKEYCVPFHLNSVYTSSWSIRRFPGR